MDWREISEADWMGIGDVTDLVGGQLVLMLLLWLVRQEVKISSDMIDDFS